MENTEHATEDAAVKKENNNGELAVPGEDKEITFVTKTGHFDLFIKVEGYKIPVVKAVLCVASPVFAAMFEGKFQEKEQHELELPEKKFKDFVEFLGCLYPDKMEPVTERNMYRLLPYACEYQVDVMEKRCRILILETFRKKHMNNPEEIYRHIQLAELYSLEELKKKAVELASELSVKQMKEGSTKYPVNDKIKMDIQTMALARHELNTADDMYILNDCYTTVTCSHSGSYSHRVYRESTDVHGSDILKKQLAWTGTCASVIRGLRLSFRFNLCLDGKLSDLCNQTIEDITNNMEEIKLLPEKLKQSLEEVCLRQDCSKFKELFC